MWLAQWLRSRSRDKTLGIRNFGVVEAGRIYRGAKPSIECYARLAALGVKLVVNLCNSGEWADHQREVLACGMSYVRIPLLDRVAPRPELVREWLMLTQASQAVPLFVHCKGGRHRTGGLVYAYRRVQCGWTHEQAYAEAERYGFYSAWGHGPWKTWMERYRE
jgi:protein tyrosine/serine phosphatase